MAKVSLRSYNQEIDSYIDSGQFEQAISHCRHILRQFSKHIDTYRLLGKAYLESQRYGDAADVFQRVLSSVPEDYIAHVGMSIIREDEGNLDASIWHMERASEVQPANKAIQSELRRLYGRRDRVEPPRVRLTRGALARMYYKGELYPQAIAELRAALAEDPQRPDLQLLLANAYFKSGLRVEAADTCSALIRKLPYCYEANYMLAEILAKSKRAQESKIYYQRVHELDPYSAHVSEKALTPDQVPEAAVTIDRMEYTPGETQEEVSSQPDWATSLGVEVEGIEASEEALPEWLSDIPQETAETKKSVEEKFESVPPFTFPEDQAEDIVSEDLQAKSEASEQDLASVFDLIQQQAESASGEDQSQKQDLIPDWMKAAGWVAAGEAIKEGTPPLSEEEVLTSDEIKQDTKPSIPQADLPEWLQAIAPSGDQVTEDLSEPEVSTSDLDESAAMTWLEDDLPETTESVGTWLEETKADAKSPSKPDIPTEDIPAWLSEAVDASTAEVEDIPDWLTELDAEISGEPLPPAAIEAQQSSSDESSSQLAEASIPSGDDIPEDALPEGADASSIHTAEPTDEDTQPPSEKISPDTEADIPAEELTAEPTDEDTQPPSEEISPHTEPEIPAEELTAEPTDEDIQPPSEEISPHTEPEIPAEELTVEPTDEDIQPTSEEIPPDTEAEIPAQELITEPTEEQPSLMEDKVTDDKEPLETETMLSIAGAIAGKEVIEHAKADTGELEADEEAESIISQSDELHPQPTVITGAEDISEQPHPTPPSADVEEAEAEEEQESSISFEAEDDTLVSVESLPDIPESTQETTPQFEEEIAEESQAEIESAQRMEVPMPEEDRFEDMPESTPFESIPSDEEDQELPDWLQELDAAGGDESGEELEPADIPDWLRELAPSSEMEQAVAEQIEGTVSEEEFEEEIDIEIEEEISELPSAEVVAGAAVGDTISEWLRNFDEDQTQAPGTEARKEEAVSPQPDWLPTMFEDADQMKEEHEIGAEAPVPPFVPEESQEEELMIEIDEGPIIEGDTKPSILKQTAQETFEAGEPVTEETQVEAFPEPEEIPAEMPSWLVGLAAEPEDEVEAEAELSDELPDWLRSLATETEETAPETIEEGITPETEAVMDEAEEVLEEAEIPDWLQELAPEEPGALEVEELEAEALEIATEEEPSQIEPEVEPQAEVVVEAELETPATEPEPVVDQEEEDAAFAWLESLAVKQGAEEALLLSPDERREMAPEWVQEAAEDEIPQAEDVVAADTVETIEAEAAIISEEIEEATQVPGAGEEPAEIVQPEAILEPEIDVEEAILEEDVETEGPPEAELIEEAVAIQAEPGEAAELEVAEVELEVAEGEISAEEAELIAEELSVEQAEVEPAEEVPELPSWLEGIEEEEISEAETPWQPPETVPAGEFEIAEQVPEPALLNLNQASLAEIERLPGVGFVRALALINYIQEQGDLSRLEDLQNVEGFDSELIENLRDHVKVELEVAEAPAEEIGDEWQIALLQARNAIVQDDPSEALEKYNALIEARQMLPNVITDLREALYRFPVDINLWQALGDAYARSGQLQEALDAYTKAEELLR